MNPMAYGVNFVVRGVCPIAGLSRQVDGKLGMRRRTPGELGNSDIAELLAAEAEKASYPLQRALRKAGRSAFLWPVEAAELARQNRSLTELRAIGPFLEKLILGWLDSPPEA